MACCVRESTAKSVGNRQRESAPQRTEKADEAAEKHSSISCSCGWWGGIGGMSSRGGVAQLDAAERARCSRFSAGIISSILRNDLVSLASTWSRANLGAAGGWLWGRRRGE